MIRSSMVPSSVLALVLAVACAGGGSSGGVAAGGVGGTSGAGTSTGGSTSGGTTPSNVAAEARFLATPSQGTGPITIEFALLHAASVAASVAIEHSVDQGQTWFPATLAQGAVTALATSPTGEPHTVSWDAAADLGPTRQDARVRVTPVSPVSGIAAESADFVVDLTAIAATTRLARYPFVQNVTNNSAVIVWQTERPAAGEVHFGTTPALGSIAASMPPPNTNQHEVLLSGLPLDTTVYYRVYSGSEPLTPGESFRTAPDVSTTGFKFAVVGDSGQGNQAQSDIARLIAGERPAFVLHTGDVIYPYGSYSDYQQKFFDPYRDIARKAPFFLCLGNHDILTAMGAPYVDVFALPSNNGANRERYYSFDWGNARFISVDTSIGFILPGSKQHTWLMGELQRARPDWLFVFFHFPLYSAGDHGSTTWLRWVIEPLFDSALVDVVFSGHDHNYERTTPQGQASTVHFVTGGGGAGLRAVGHESFTAVSESVHHFMSVEIAGRTFTARAIRQDGSVLDTLTITK